MNKLYIAGVLVFIGIMYLLIVNLAVIQIYSSDNTSYEKNISNYSGEKVGVSDSVSVVIKSKRWYGTIYRYRQLDKSLDILYLFNILKIPNNVNGTSIIPINICVFLFLLCIFIVLVKFS